MRRIVGLVLAGLLAASLATPAAAGRSGRTVTKDYTMADGAIVSHGGGGAEAHWYLGANREIFRIRPAERFVSFSISDNAGQPVRGHIHIDTDGDGRLEELDDFCEETPKPIAVGVAREVEVAVIFGPCHGGDLSIVTQGTITATFSK